MVDLFQRLYIDSFKGLSKELWFLSLVVFINRAGLMVVPFLALYLINEIGWTKTETGIATGALGLGALFGSLLGGWIADRYGTIPTMIFGLIAGGLAILCIPYFEGFYILCFWLCFTSTVGDVFRPAVFTAAGEYSKEEDLTRSISLIRLAINLGVAIGPAAGGFLAAYYGYDWIFIIDGITCILAGIVLYYYFYQLYPDRIRHKKEAIIESNNLRSSPYRDAWFLIFLGFCILTMVSFFQILFSIPVFFKEVYSLSETDVGWFFTANGLMIFIFEMPIIYYLEKKQAALGPIILGTIIIGLAILPFIFVNDYLTAIIVYSILVAFGEIINFPFISVVGLKRATTEAKGKYMGVVSLMFSLGYFLAPLCGLPLIDWLGYNNYWWISAGMAIVAGVGILLMRKWLISP